MNKSADKTNDFRSGTFRLVARSAEAAAGAIRQQLGERAKVVSVRSVPVRGWQRFLGASRIEVIAEVPPLEGRAGSSEAATRIPAVAGFQSGGVMISDAGGPEAGAPALADWLRGRGVSQAALRQMESLPFWSGIADNLPLAESFGLMRDDLCRLGAAHRGRSLPARTAFLGGPGAGKTTALCRWLHREVVRHGRLGVVWWMEPDAGPVSPALSACCEQLRIPLVRHGSEASPAGGDFVYVDPPPISADPEANARMRDFLEREEITGRVLVLNAAYADKSLLAACKAGRALGATHVVLTHLDEVSCWPGLWEVLLGEGLAPLFLTASAGWAPGITENVIEAMLERTLPAS